jgi:hypothetical protein
MTDILRSDRSAAAADVPERERDERVEQLLLGGLDQYFGGHHERAINIWTRVLFLNHGHARARAYIERARSAIAERQREGDELLHTGIDAVRRGDTSRARALLTSAAERGAASDETLAALARLQRLETAASVEPPPGEDQPPARQLLADRGAAGAGRLHVSRRLLWSLGIAVVAALAVATGVESWMARVDAPRGLLPALIEPLPVPSRGELEIAEARALQSTGHLREALAILDGVRRTDRAWGEARGLRVIIQQQLLSGAGTPMPALPRTDVEGVSR